jgi:hypothetical protein
MGQGLSVSDLVLGALGAVYALALAFGAQVWLDMRRRMETVELRKSEKDEVEELREEVRTLADDVKRGNDATHVINVSMARLIEQVARIVSDIESEKRTRAETSKALMEEIRRSEASIIARMTQVVTYGRRKGDLPQ